MLQLNLTQTRASNHLCSSAAKFGTNEGCGLDLIDFVASSIEAQLDQLLLMLTNNDNNNNNNNRKGNKNGPKLHQLGFSGDEDETDDEQTAWRPGGSSSGPVDAETLRRYVNSLRWCPTGGGCSNDHGQKTNGCGNELTLRHLRQRFRPDVTRAYLALKAAELVGDFSGADAEQVDCSCEEKAFSLHFHGADSWCDLVAVIAALSEADQQLRLAVVCFCEEPALLPHLEFLREAILTSGLTRGCRVESMRLSSRP
uniref:C3H1-type domain-containing protein n=1 Tax=Macrostomum lignano TaxID=282301 RepID=A0A1I8JBR2_9PLAT